MGGIAFIILFALLFVFSVYIGFLIGQAICERRAVTVRDYWLLNGAGVGIIVVLSMFASLLSLPLLDAVLIGLLAGYIAGMKMSFGESVGPWKVLDRFLNINRGHRKTAEDGTGEARRRRRKAGERGPDLISVEGTASANERNTKTSSKKDSR